MQSPVTAGPVVVGIDGSDAGLAALDRAVDEAVRHGHPLRIVPVGLELGRVAHRALHHASCPVAVVPQRRSAPSEGEQ